MASKPRALILDLDQTLVDSRCAKQLRSQRRWPEVKLLIPRFVVAPGAIDLCRVDGLKVAVVTKSPSNYANAVLEHFRIRTDVVVAYHDAAPQKPHPAPTLKALELLGIQPADAWAAGDHSDDLASARAAGIATLIAVKGLTDSEAELAKAQPTVTVTHPSEVLSMLRRLGMPC